jgi:plastocyanin
VDEVAYPAITRLAVTNSGFAAYLFNNQYSGNNPTIYAISGTTIAFNLNVAGHPFLIRTALGAANYDTGLIHVATDGTVTTGSSAQGKTTGTLYWQVPSNINGAYSYLCSLHSGMLGVIMIKDIVTLGTGSEGLTILNLMEAI